MSEFCSRLHSRQRSTTRISTRRARCVCPSSAQRTGNRPQKLIKVCARILGASVPHKTTGPPCFLPSWERMCAIWYWLPVHSCLHALWFVRETFVCKVIPYGTFFQKTIKSFSQCDIKLIRDVALLLSESDCFLYLTHTNTGTGEAHSIYHSYLYAPNDVVLAEWTLPLTRTHTHTPVIQALVALVHEPEPEHPLRGDLAEEFTKDRAKFNKNALEFTRQHAEKRPADWRQWNTACVLLAPLTLLCS